MAAKTTGGHHSVTDAAAATAASRLRAHAASQPRPEDGLEAGERQEFKVVVWRYARRALDIQIELSTRLPALCSFFVFFVYFVRFMYRYRPPGNKLAVE